MMFFKNESKQAEEPVVCQEENRVIVRVWTSKRNRAVLGRDVGHVSLETTTPKAYISLWPNRGIRLVETLDVIPHNFLVDHEADVAAEDRSAEITLCLYSLNTELLLEAWQQARENLEGWTLVGSNKLINQGHANSCSGLAYDLLKKAGIYELISRTRFSSTFSSVVTPDDLGRAVAKAKEAELNQFPETDQFVFEGETELEAPLSRKGNFECAMM